jgi:hypothetical protein
MVASQPNKHRIQRLVNHINRKSWWHVKPVDAMAYEKRGKFLSSSFAEAEFYGRPTDRPEKVTISCPLVGDNDSIERRLLGDVESNAEIRVGKRLALDAKLQRAALKKGYDAIVLMTPPAYRRFRDEGTIPRSIELNVLDLRCVTSSDQH